MDRNSPLTFADLATAPHSVARTQVHKSLTGSVTRAHVPDEQVAWNTDLPQYRPTEVDRPEKGWPRDPADAGQVKDFPSLEGTIERDEETGRPLNPAGRTGMSGRGILASWGASQAADAVLTRHNPDNGQLEVLVIERGDATDAAVNRSEYALVGGWRDPLPNGEMESAATAAERETVEETSLAGVELNLAERGQTVFAGYVDDPRNTDNAWMETTAIHRHLTPAEAKQVTIGSGPQQGARAPGEAPEIRGAQWAKVTKGLSEQMYASHGAILKAATDRLPKLRPGFASESQSSTLGQHHSAAANRGIGGRG